MKELKFPGKTYLPLRNLKFSPVSGDDDDDDDDYDNNNTNFIEL